MRLTRALGLVALICLVPGGCLIAAALLLQSAKKRRGLRARSCAPDTEDAT